MEDTAVDTSNGGEAPPNAKLKLSHWANDRLVKLELVLGKNFKKIQSARQGVRQRLNSALGSIDASLEASLSRGERTATGWLETARGVLPKPVETAPSNSAPAA